MIKLTNNTKLIQHLSNPGSSFGSMPTLFRWNTLLKPVFVLSNTSDIFCFTFEMVDCRIFLLPMIKMVGQIMEMVRTNRNVGPLIERGLSEDTTNRTTVVAIKALANPTDLSANTPPFPWNKNYLSSLELCSMKKFKPAYNI